jgi:T5SS/PEP-CTERM-associated repeat protein
MLVSNGGTVTDANGYIGFDASSSNNSVLVTGSGSFWMNSGDINIGLNGSANSVSVTNGGTIIGNGSDRIALGVGGYSSNNFLNLSGPNSSIGNIGLMVGGDGFLWTKPLPTAPVRVSYATWLRRDRKPATLDLLDRFTEEMHKIPASAGASK